MPQRTWTIRLVAAALAVLLGAAACRDAVEVDGCPASRVIASSADWEALLTGPCREIDGDLYILVKGVSALSGAAPLTRVGGRLAVVDTDRLLELHLPLLASVGSLEVSGNLALSKLDLPALTTAGGELTVVGNRALPGLLVPRLARLPAAAAATAITRNPSWPQCDVLDFVATHGGSRDDPAVLGNGPWRYGEGLCAQPAPPDAGPPDAGGPDAGPADGGVPDAGRPDAGTPDAGVPDAGVLDAGIPDAGLPDAGVPDAGPPTTPRIRFTSVPALGAFDPLLGVVTGADPAQFRVAVFIQVNGGWWTKPYWDHPVTTIAADGTFSCNVTTGGQDERASALAAFLLPAGVVPPLASGQGSLPPELAQSAVAMTSAQR